MSSFRHRHSTSIHHYGARNRRLQTERSPISTATNGARSVCPGTPTEERAYHRDTEKAWDLMNRIWEGHDFSRGFRNGWPPVQSQTSILTFLQGYIPSVA